ncbi:hypothetical protein K461DRAFT_147943 [Myriangium duriaei CBS 260.36]|uniref:Uncharacterized protein n=1 Tax=Myriangium duriaei CBS 260.36 TaxID=1168546 RepID=A0A9P4J0N5_9PEZI|nr:hypothetical protein K461DRAFT_147943 [Myriangium duriaei CBS 260.36]
MAGWSAAQCSDLPRGSCNFSDLTQGPGAPICPCQRFYLDRSRQDLRYGHEQNFYCFCAHHACFHTFDRTVEPSRSTQHIVSDNDADTVISGQRPLFGLGTTHLRHTSCQVPAQTSHADQATNNRPAPMGIWEALHLTRQNATNQVAGSSALPSTASQTSQPPRPPPASLAKPQRYNQSFNARLQHHYESQHSPMSATEVNTPSAQGSPLFVQPYPHPIPSKENTTTEPERKDAGTQCQPDQLGRASRTQKDAVVRDLVARVARLESLSYSHVPLEEVEDKFEDHGYRISTLEEFRTEIEPRLLSHDTNSTSEEATTSASSVSSSCQSPASASSPTPSADAAVYRSYEKRFHHLESRIDGVIRSVPSPEDPWHVEVVLLPWGRNLPGIWFADSKSDEELLQRSREEWNELTFAAHPKLGESFSSRSTSSGDFIREWRDITSNRNADLTPDWYNARILPLHGVARKRLWSRGLIQTVEVSSNDAFTFMQKCKDAFQSVIRQGQPKETSIPLALRKKYDALEEPLVPLRKIRKVTRLSFLAPSEMVTAAAWTPTFLDSSVFMKNGELKRLFVTFPESYVQRFDDDGWTWQIIRGLRPTRQPSPRAGPGFDGVDKSADFKSCWNYHSPLDAPRPVITTSISEATAVSHHGDSNPISGTTNDNGMLLNAPSPLLSPISETKTLRINRRRTTSLSSIHQSESSAPGVSTKRRFSSKPEDVASKRRCLSTTSDRSKPGSAAITPRLSRERSIPVTSNLPIDAISISDGPSSSRRASNTPMAYPTPHSNYIHTVSTVRLTDRDGETEADTEIEHGRSSPFRAEEEWQGMGDDDGQPSSSVRFWDEDESRLD